MRKLSLDEMMFGMIEGKQYTLHYGDGVIARDAGKFVKYTYERFHYCAKFQKESCVLYSMIHETFDRWWTDDGRYFTTED
jgi:hypothetical protein